jgi:hypothetical protein
MPPRVLARVGSWPAFVALIVGACGVSPTPTPIASPSSAPPSAIVTALPTVSVAPPALPSASPADLSTHPFTVLVLGGDNGFRTDAMIVVGVDPVARTLAFASIPAMSA